MADPDIVKWRLQGCLYLWRYEPANRNTAGWHFNADKDGCRSLVDLIDRMLTSKWKASRQIELTPLPRVQKFNPGTEWESAPALLLRFPKGEVEANLWHLELTPEALSLTLGEAKLRELQQSIAELPQWKDDFALGPKVDRRKAKDRELWDANCLWFWTKIA